MSGYVLFWLLGLLIVAVSWTYGTQGAEAALKHARRACAEASVQLLDQTVSFRRFEWRGGSLKRIYSFDYCPDGKERFRGLLWLRGRGLDYLAFDQAAGGFIGARATRASSSANSAAGSHASNTVVSLHTALMPPRQTDADSIDQDTPK
jgi:Protein of unknown function (DUF3301)